MKIPKAITLSGQAWMLSEQVLHCWNEGTATGVEGAEGLGGTRTSMLKIRNINQVSRQEERDDGGRAIAGKRTVTARVTPRKILSHIKWMTCLRIEERVFDYILELQIPRDIRLDNDLECLVLVEGLQQLWR